MRVADKIIRVYKIYDIKLGSNDNIQISELNNLNRRIGATSWSRSRNSHN